MAKPNYEFEKRKKELAKIKKREEKRQKKQTDNVDLDNNTSLGKESNDPI